MVTTNWSPGGVARSSLGRSLAQSLARSLGRSVTRSLARSSLAARSLARSVARPSPARSLASPPPPPPRCSEIVFGGFSQHVGRVAAFLGGLGLSDSTPWGVIRYLPTLRAPVPALLCESLIQYLKREYIYTDISETNIYVSRTCHNSGSRSPFDTLTSALDMIFRA